MPDCCFITVILGTPLMKVDKALQLEFTARNLLCKTGIESFKIIFFPVLEIFMKQASGQSES